MSSPSRTVDRGAAEPARAPALADGDTLIDTGEPIDDLPPLIEPVVWETPGPRPARRKFLAGPTAIALAVPRPPPAVGCPDLRNSGADRTGGGARRCGAGSA